MKKTIIFIFLSLLLTIPLNAALASGTTNFVIKDQAITDVWATTFTDQNGQEKEYLMVPLRDAAQLLGLTVTWYQESKIATVKPVRNEYLKNLSDLPVKNCMYFSTTIIFKDNSSEIGLTDYFSSASYEMEGRAKAILKGEKMYVPSTVFTDFLAIKQ